MKCLLDTSCTRPQWFINMYSVYNKALDQWLKSNGTTRKFIDLSQEELEEISQKYNFPIPDDNRPDPDREGESILKSVEIEKAVKEGLKINWVARIANDAMFKNPSYRKLALSTMKAEEFYEMHQNEELGLFNLAPGHSQELRKVKRILDQLILSGHADKIQITDTDTNEVIWDGGIVEYEYSHIAINFKGEKYEKKDKAFMIGNLIHPEKKREAYYPAKKNVVESIVTDQELETLRKEYEELFGRKPVHNISKENLKKAIEEKLNS